MAIVQRITRAVVAAAALAVAAGVAVVAASFALYALLRDPLTPAGAAAVVAGIAALVVLLVAVLMGGRSKPKPRHAEEGPMDFGEHAGTAARLVEIARGHPVIAVGAALAGAYVVMRRPGLLALLAANVLGAKRQKQRDRAR